jgi:uncharacterized protein YdhG (YjbR/CyaY superfamily)
VSGQRNRRTKTQIEYDAMEMLQILEQFSEENPTQGMTVNGLTKATGLSRDHVTATIAYIRNVMEEDGAFVVHQVVKGTSIYFVPGNAEEAVEYTDRRLKIVKRHVRNVLFLVEKIESRWGASRSTRITHLGLTRILQDLEAITYGSEAA